MTAAARALAVADRIRQAPAPVCVVLCPRAAELPELAAAVPPLAALAGPGAAVLRWAQLPALPEDTPDDPLPERLREELTCDRLAALTGLANFHESPPPDERLVVFTTPDGLAAPVAPRAELARRELRLRAGERPGFDALKARLAGELDYDAEAVCERPGQYALRGGLIDVYPLNAPAPVRLDFFGDELESIRSFDPATQRTLEPLREVTLAARAAGAPPAAAEPGAILSYFGAAVSWVLLEPRQLRATGRFARGLLDALGRRAAADTWQALQEFGGDPEWPGAAVVTQSLPFQALEPHRPQPWEGADGLERLEEEQQARAAFAAVLQQWQAQRGIQLLSLLPPGRAAELERLLGELGVRGLRLRHHEGDLPEGVLLEPVPDGWLGWMDPPPAAGLALLTAREWFGRPRGRPAARRQRMLPHRARVDELLDFADLADGDYLVHLAHGICRYRGLNRLELRGREEDVISVEFADAVTLHVPLPDAHLLTRYVGLTRAAPRLGKLGSGLWERTRAAAEKATLDYAAEMLQLQARRACHPGHAFSPDSEWQRVFEDAFPYTETPDQTAAIEDTKLDMEQPKPMDRLLCGDVGFGKTEVAIRAAFKAVMDGFQVAVLAPTTVLAQQHYQTFRERFAAYPFTVEMLSRFRTPARQKEIVAAVATGRVDILIGTHRMLSADVRFARLGLLVVDEEHRFGVRHKDRLKRFKAEVDILSMSATPIPRTLYLALMGARDLSLIETPPADRLPIETIVRPYDPEVVRRAITRELERGGQVFYLHNRVQTIDSVAARLGQLLPQARIATGHGQMPEQQLERVMTRFVAGESDILVCTTIIENGLDIRNCNTLIIEGADRFGLSQLYQLRGRVGRFTRQAYAYLLLHRHGHMLDVARQRLSAIRQHSQLGAGFRIAMRDLELRGAGNLLGHQQSGHIAGVGFDLYCQLLRQSIQRLKGEPAAARIRATVTLDFITEARGGDAPARRDDTAFGALAEAEIAATRIDPVPAFLPARYIGEARLRIDFYRQLAMADSLAAVAEIGRALADRFGKPPRPVGRLLAVTRIRVRAELAGIRAVETEGNRLKCLRASPRRDDYLKPGGRFPRLTGRTADLRLRDIEHFLTPLCQTDQP